MILPPLDAGDYLVGYLFEVGPTLGEGPISHLEIAAWCSLTGRELQPWEVTALRSMSAAYLDEAMEATEPARAPPAWVGEKPSREAVSKNLGEMLRRMAEQDERRGGG